MGGFGQTQQQQQEQHHVPGMTTAEEGEEEVAKEHVEGGLHVEEHSKTPLHAAAVRKWRMTLFMGTLIVDLVILRERTCGLTPYLS